MESIELEKGWLVRQMEEVRQEVEKWPDVLKPLMTMNSSLVHPKSLDNRLPQRCSIPKVDLPKAAE